MIGSDREQIEIYLSGRSIEDKDVFSKSDPQCYVYYKSSGGQEVKLGKTEVQKNNLNPNWKKSFQMEFIFEQKQFLRFVVKDEDTGDSDDFIGSVETTVSSVMGARNQTLILDLKSKKGKFTGKLIIRGDKCNEGGNHQAMWQWQATKLTNVDGWFDKSDPFLRFFKIQGQGTDNQILVHETEFVKDNLNPIWKMFQIPLSKLCGNDFNRPFKIECWDNEKSGKHQYIGQITITINDLVQKKQKDFQLINTAKGNKPAGLLSVNNFNVIQVPSFIDYLRGGEQLNMIVAIDFTASNGEFREPNSLHAISKDGQPNQYQRALMEVCGILLNYDYDQKIPVYGFGGKPRYPNYTTQQVDHCFPLTGDPKNPEVQGMQGIMSCYQQAQQMVGLYALPLGPTLFGPMIQYASQVAYVNQSRDIYTVLLIITDGEIHDMQATMDLIIKASNLPLSIIIVGVGNDDFTNMKQLDGDDSLKQLSSNCRDLVQFVEYKKYQLNPQLLAQEVLAELPSQLVKYKQIMNIPPKQAIAVNMDGIK